MCPMSVALLRNYWSSATVQLFYPLPGNDQGKDLLLSGQQIGSDWQQRENNGLCNWTTDTLCDFSKKKKRLTLCCRVWKRRLPGLEAVADLVEKTSLSTPTLTRGVR